MCAHYSMTIYPKEFWSPLGMRNPRYSIAIGHGWLKYNLLKTLKIYNILSWCNWQPFLRIYGRNEHTRKYSRRLRIFWLSAVLYYTVRDQGSSEVLVKRNTVRSRCCYCNRTTTEVTSTLSPTNVVQITVQKRFGGFPFCFSLTLPLARCLLSPSSLYLRRRHIRFL